MKRTINPLYALPALTVAASLILPLAAFAAAPTFTANQTVANVTTGADTQAVATTSTTANVVEVKATRTITANSVPTVPVTLTIGTCAITITSSVASDVDCSNNNAAIATSTDTTAAAIAARIRTITGLSDTGHGALTIGGSGSTASFTTTGTESSATAITATLSTGSDFTLTTVNTTGVIPVAQVWTYTPSNVEVGDIFTAIINGTTVNFTATAATVANVTAGLTAAINASAQSSAVLATDQTTRIDVSSKTAGTPFTLTKGATNRAAVAQVVVFTPANVTTGYRWYLNINSGQDFIDNPATIQAVVEGLKGAVNDPNVTCTEDDTAITCTAVAAGTGFTFDTLVSLHSGGGGGGGGGGSSSGSSSSSSSAGSTQSMIDSIMAQIHALMGQQGTGSTPGGGSWSSDLRVGSSGSGVHDLQAYLNSHGAPIASSGPGSPGNETSIFGALTKTALAKFQASVGITPASGFFGPKTRAYISSHP